MFNYFQYVMFSVSHVMYILGVPVPSTQLAFWLLHQQINNFFFSINIFFSSTLSYNKTFLIPWLILLDSQFRLLILETLHCFRHQEKNTYAKCRGLRWSRVRVLAFITQVRGFKPGRSRRIFRAKKSSARLPSEGK